MSMDSIDVLGAIIAFYMGGLLIEIPSIIKQCYIEKHIAEKHEQYAYSKNAKTRAYCAFYGYHLDVLQNDKKWQVRIEVVRKGYNVKKFLDDKNTLVRNEAIRQLKKPI